MNERSRELIGYIDVNPKIKELADQAGCSIDKLGYGEGNLEKFAELIVRECVEIAYEYDAPKMSGPGMIIGNRIEEHFKDGMSTEDKKTLIKELLGVKND